MRILVLGGTVFVGRAVVSEARARGDEVAVFNRGRSGSVPDGVEQITGDRTDPAALAQLAGRPFDLVVDTAGYVAADVAASAAVLAPTSGHYAFVSTINVFPGWPEAADYHVGGVHDGDPDATRDDVPSDIGPGGAYGWLKVGCERAVVRAFGADRSTILRGGCIVGPEDSVTARLPWWIDRIARGGEVLVPGRPDDPMSLIDARDLAGFALDRVPGTFETSGPAGRDTWATLMDAGLRATGSDARLTYVDSHWLAGQAVEPWTEIPLWAGDDAPSLYAHDPAAAAAAGFRWRPLAETVSDVWAWQQSVPGGWHAGERTPGLAADREQELLTAWHERPNSPVR